jgi:hypothetical protein
MTEKHHCPLSFDFIGSRRQSGMSEVSKLEPRIHLGIFVGYSPLHPRSAAMDLINFNYITSTPLV